MVIQIVLYINMFHRGFVFLWKIKFKYKTIVYTLHTNACIIFWLQNVIFMSLKQTLNELFAYC